MFNLRCTIIATTLALGAHAALANPNQNQGMKQLAAKSGCIACHSIEPGKAGPDGMAPIGPAWQDVAERYKGDKSAAKTLTKTVLEGNNPYKSHWKGRVSGIAMPPNAVAIKEADARKLVNWILGLNTAGVARDGSIASR